VTPRDHDTTTSLFSATTSRPEVVAAAAAADGGGAETKQRDAMLKRFYRNTLASLYKSLDSFARLPGGPFDRSRLDQDDEEQLGGGGGGLATEIELRRSASIQHIASDTRPQSLLSNPDRPVRWRRTTNNNTSTFPLSSRHHSHSIQTLSDLSAQQNRRDPVKPETEMRRGDVTDDRKRSDSGWNANAVSAVAALPGPGKTANTGDQVEAERSGKELAGTGTKTAEMRVVLGASFAAAEPSSKRSSRCLTVRQSAGVSTLGAVSAGTSSSSSVSLAFVSPRPIRKRTHHLQPMEYTPFTDARPTSAAALERY